MFNIVLDTNCLIMSISARNSCHRVWQSFLAGEYTLCVSNEIVEEYLEVLSRNINPWVAESIVSAILMRRNVLKVDPHFRFHLIERDSDDNKFVDCAICANAKYIVSEDHHFDILRKCSFPKVEVVGIDLFINILKTRPYSSPDEDTPMLFNEEMEEYSGKKSESDC